MEDFRAVLSMVRSVRADAVQRDMNPWYFRQALVVTLRLDTLAALEMGFKQEQVDAFDELAKEQADSIAQGT